MFRYFIYFMIAINVINLGSFAAKITYNANTPYQTTKTTLVSENGKEIILQGMTHIGTPEFYLQVSDEITNSQYQHYFELIMPEEHIPQLFNNEYSVDKLDLTRQMFFDIFKTGINADISNEEMTEYLAKDGKKINELDSFKKDIEAAEKGIEKYIYMYEDLPFYFLSDYNLNIIPKAVLRYAVRQEDRTLTESEAYEENLILNVRNDILLSKINFSENAYISYGQAHVEDILNKLKLRGYSVVKTEYIDAI
jgi:hypothetical protein